MKKIHMIIMMMLLAAGVRAAPVYSLKADIQFPDRSLPDLTFLQGATPTVRVYVRQNGVTYTNIATDKMVFYYGTNINASGFVIVTNTSKSADSGYFDVPFAATNLNTNGSFSYAVLLTTVADATYYSGTGDLTVVENTMTGSPGSLDLSTPLDWDGFVFSSPASGPVLPGTHITATTNGTTGQVTFNADGGGSANITNLGAGAAIDITGSGGDRTIAHSNTSSQASITNTAGTVIQSLDFDTMGHVTLLTSYDLDGRYYTETEVDALAFMKASNNDAGADTTNAMDSLTARLFGLPTDGSTNTITAASTISSTNGTIYVSSAADVTITNLPNVADGDFDAQILVIYNEGAFQIEIQDEALLPGSGYEGEGVNRILNSKSLIALQWHEDDDSWHLLSNPTAQQEAGALSPTPVRNTTGDTITNGFPVYFSGYSGGRSLVTIADTSTKAAIGIVDGNIANNQNGEIVTSGTGPAMDTTDNGAFIEGSVSEGDNVWVNTNGAAKPYTATRPNVDGVQKIGVVKREHATQGRLTIVGAGRFNDVPNDISTETTYNVLNVTNLQAKGDVDLNGFDLDDGGDCSWTNGVFDEAVSVGTTGAGADLNLGGAVGAFSRYVRVDDSIVSTNTLGQWAMGGTDGATEASPNFAGYIRGHATGPWNSTNSQGEWTFWTTPAGSTTPVWNWTIEDDGALDGRGNDLDDIGDIDVTNVVAESVLIGIDNTNAGAHSLIVGDDNNMGSGSDYSAIIGIDNTAAGRYGLTVGNNNTNAGFLWPSITFGSYNYNGGNFALAAGSENYITQGNQDSMAIGHGCRTIANRVIAMGMNATGTHANTFIWSDGQTGDGVSSAANEWTVYASGGIRLLGGEISGDGAGLTNLDKSGNWTGTLDSQEGAWYVDDVNMTNRRSFITIPFIPTNANYELIAMGPFESAVTLNKFYIKVDSSTCEVSIVEQDDHALWDVFESTNNALVVGVTTGIYDSTWADSAVGASNLLYLRFENVGATCSNGVATIWYTEP
jgi:hypothetical protein